MYDSCENASNFSVALWPIALDGDALSAAPARSALLSTDELARARRFHFARDRQAFIVAHAALREILGSLAQRHPRAMRFIAGRYGKPYLADPRLAWLQFSLSHSNGLALLATTRDVPIGVDIERIDAALPFEPVATQALSPHARDDLKQTPLAQKRRRFYQWWARTEAVLKASGVGFADNAAASELQQFAWMDLPLDADFSAALAWPNRFAPPQIQFMRAPSTSAVTHTSR